MHRLRVVLEHFARFLIIADFFNALALEIPALHLFKKARVCAPAALQDRAGAIFLKKHWKQRETEVVWSANHALKSEATLTNTLERFNSRRVARIVSSSFLPPSDPWKTRTQRNTTVFMFVEFPQNTLSSSIRSKGMIAQSRCETFTRFNQIVNN